MGSVVIYVGTTDAVYGGTINNVVLDCPTKLHMAVALVNKSVLDDVITVNRIDFIHERRSTINRDNAVWVCNCSMNNES